MGREDLALDGLLRQLARRPEADDAFVERVLSRTTRRPSRRPLSLIAATGLFAVLGFFLAPAPTGRMGFSRQSGLVPDAKTMRVITRDGDRPLLLGEVSVNAQVRVPAGLPLLLQAVAADGLALWTDRDLIRLRPGEVRTPSPGAIVTLEKKSARSVGYARDVKPILDRYCAECHAESALLATARPFEARGSALVMETHGLLPLAARRQLALWVDLGAPKP